MLIPKEEILAALGDSFTNSVVARLKRLAHVPASQFSKLSDAALSENWGNDNYVLEISVAAMVTSRTFSVGTAAFAPVATSFCGFDNGLPLNYGPVNRLLMHAP